jgi:hypothetical protein
MMNNGEISVLKDEEVTNMCKMTCRTSREITRPAIMNPVARLLLWWIVIFIYNNFGARNDFAQQILIIQSVRQTE